MNNNISVTNIPGNMRNIDRPRSSYSQSTINTTDSFQKQDYSDVEVVDLMKTAGKLIGKKLNVSSFSLWEYQMDPDQSIHITRGKSGGLYATGQNGKIAALDEKTGGKKWEYDMKVAIEAPVVEGNKGDVYCGDSKGNFTAIDGKTGKMKWTFSFMGLLGSKPTVGPDETIYFTDSNNKVFAVDGETGKQKWVFQTNSQMNTTPVLDEKGVLFASGSNGGLYALDSKTGKLKWKNNIEVSAQTSPISATKNTLIVGSEDKKILGIDKESGDIKWQHKTIRWATHPALTPNGILVEADHNNVLFGLDPETGKELWKIDTPTYDHLFPMIGEDGLIYITTTENSPFNKLCAINAEDGKTVLEQKIGRGEGWKAAAAWDKEVVVGVNDGKIQAFVLNEINGAASGLLQLKRTEHLREQEQIEGQPETKQEITFGKGEVIIGGVNLPVRNTNS